MNYDDILKSIEYRIGKAPRKFSFFERINLKLDKPDWDYTKDAFVNIINNWDRVFIHGVLAWGHIIQVNSLMFERSPLNCPGEVAAWTDKINSFDAEALENIAHSLFELKGESKYITESANKFFAEYLENERTRVFGLPVPKDIASGNEVKVSSVFFQRKHIPGKVITQSLFPVLYLESDPMIVVMLPYKFWPKSLVRDWVG